MLFQWLSQSTSRWPGVNCGELRELEGEDKQARRASWRREARAKPKAGWELDVKAGVAHRVAGTAWQRLSSMSAPEISVLVPPLCSPHLQSAPPAPRHSAPTYSRGPGTGACCCPRTWAGNTSGTYIPSR